VVLTFSASQAALNSALAVLKSWDEPVGSPPGRWTVTFQSQTPGWRSSAKRMRPIHCSSSNSLRFETMFLRRARGRVVVPG
jgi:hypothetical protein